MKDAFDHMWRDVVLTCPSRATARAVSTRVARTYLYQFTHVTAVGATYKLGSFHAAELPLAFGNFVAALGPATPFERTLSDKMMTMWTTFAKTGEPGEDFPQYTTATHTSYSFSDSPGPSTHVEQAKCDALAKLFPM